MVAGTPLQESKRRFAVPCLYALMGLYVAELTLTSRSSHNADPVVIMIYQTAWQHGRHVAAQHDELCMAKIPIFDSACDGLPVKMRVGECSAVYSTVIIHTISPQCPLDHRGDVIVYLSWGKLAVTL